MAKLVNLIVHDESFDRWERDWIESLLADFEIQRHFDPTYKLVACNAIVVACLSKAGNDRLLKEQLKANRRQWGRVGLIHLSDEFGSSPADFYDHAQFVLRNYYHPHLAGRPNCQVFAVGYKSGLTSHLHPAPIAERRLRWSFAGQLKASRPTMLAAAQTIPGGACFLTRHWEDPNSLGLAQYADMLSQSAFVLCPRGNCSLDSFRVYEAMEAGAIPIVEDDNSALSYWHQVYGPSFPCPRIADWNDLPQVIASINVDATAAVIEQWWTRYKLSLRDLVRRTIETRLLN